jgi:hypothetical protein
MAGNTESPAPPSTPTSESPFDSPKSSSSSIIPGELYGGLIAGGARVALTPLEFMKGAEQLEQTYRNSVNESHRGLKWNVSKAMHVRYTGWLQNSAIYSLQNTIKCSLYSLFVDHMHNKQNLFPVLLAYSGCDAATAVGVYALKRDKLWLQISNIMTVDALKMTLPGHSNAPITQSGRLFSPLLGRQLLYTSSQMYVYYSMKQSLLAYREPPKRWVACVESLVIGGIAGALGAVISHPVDTMVTVMASNQKKAGETLSEIGAAGVWAGVRNRVFLLSIASAVEMTAYNYFAFESKKPR